jgi:hypothetical protein
VIALIDKVSRGGNFLLDIGPDEHGKIPPIMQERLLEIGDWMQVNDEAIYETSRWKTPSQWSDGRRDYKFKNEHAAEDWKTGGDLMLKLTVNPDPGYAVKEIFYTYNANKNSLYAIFPKYPSDKKLVLKDVTLPAGTTINFLSTKVNVSWKQEGNNVIIILPDYDPNKIAAPYAYVVKINNYGMFSKKPKINAEYINNGRDPVVSLTSAANEAIRYTTDGSEPSMSSALYTKPFIIAKTSILKAKAYLAGSLPSSTAEQRVEKYDWMNAVNPTGLKPGIAFKYFQPDANLNLIFPFQEAPMREGVANFISLAEKKRKEKFAFEFSGYIKINKDGFYTFYTSSDDGSKLYIDDIEVVDNDGNHGVVEKMGKAALKKGYHKIKVTYYDAGGGNDLKVLLQPEAGAKEELSSSLLYH